MNKKHLWILALLIAVLASCNGKKNKETIDLLPAIEQDTVTHSMAGCDFSDSTKAGNHTMTFLIHREPSDSLPIVTDEYGTKFKDNIFDLTIQRDGQPYFKHRFSKKDFLSQLTDEFRKHGMLDGFRFTGYENGILTFGTCISYPESDMSQPFFINISADGSFSIIPDNTPIDGTETDSMDME